MVQNSITWDGKVIKRVILNDKKLDCTNLIRFYADEFKKVVIDEKARA